MEKDAGKALNTWVQILDFWNLHGQLRRTILVIALLLGSAGLILPNLGFPRAIVFDEAYYVPMAQKYLNGVFYQEQHPPLARLLIALGQHLYAPDAPSDQFLDVRTVKVDWPKNVDITGYRVAPAFFGMLLPVLIFLILSRILLHDGWAFAGSLLVLFDTALLTEARSSMVESILITFCLLTILVFVILWKDQLQVQRSTYLWWAVWGVVFAAGMNVKFSALFVIVVVVVYFFRLFRQFGFRISNRFVIIFGVATVITTIAVWYVHFSLLTRLNPEDTSGISEENHQILTGELQLPPVSRFAMQFSEGIEYIINGQLATPGLRLGAIDEIGSPWYQWPFGGKAISYRWETLDGNTFRNIYLIGNPMSWLASLFGVIVGTAIAISNFFFRYYKTPHSQWVYLLTGLYWAYMGGIMMIDRVMYLYHYLPPLLIGTLLAVIIFVDIPTLTPLWRRVTVALVLVGLVAGFVAYMPFTYYTPLTRQQIVQRNIWPAWQLYIGGTPIEPP